MNSSIFQDSDLESPGYEFLRSYSSMSNLYFKLVALNYRSEFCPLYKCPPINKHYFAVPAINQVEQQFSFMCLSVWLIRDKCQMNFDADPRDYQDPESTIKVIFEAMQLLSKSEDISENKPAVPYHMSKLKRGFGPEVIFYLNKFADRALEVVLENKPNIGEARIIYYNKHKTPKEQAVASRNIVIGQPIVGGGLTTRPLGNYQVDDSSLIIRETKDYALALAKRITNDHQHSNLTGTTWDPTILERIASKFLVDFGSDPSPYKDWQSFKAKANSLLVLFENLSKRSKPVLEALKQRAESQLSTISDRERMIGIELASTIERFMPLRRFFTAESKENASLGRMVNIKTNALEHCARKLKEIRLLMKKVDDGSRFEEIEFKIHELGAQTAELSKLCDSIGDARSSTSV